MISALLALVFAPSASPPRVTAADDLTWAPESALDDFVKTQREAMRLPALVVGVIMEGEIWRVRAIGDAAPGGPLASGDTPFALGSTSKQFLGLAVQQLIADGSLSVDDTVRDVIGDLLPADGGAFADVTVTQLLSHHSGLAYADGLRQWESWQSAPSLDAHVRMLLALPATGTAGAGYEYSNANYTVLGAMIEHVHGTPYADALEQLVLQPLGLASTTADASAKRATGFYPWFGLVNIPTPAPISAAAVPSAFVTSTADDLLRLLGAHLGVIDTDFPDAALRAAREPIAKEHDWSQVASGWSVRPFWELREIDDDREDVALPRVWEHNGTTPRAMSYLAMQPELGLGVVVLANTGAGLDQARLGVFAHRLLHTLAGTEPPAAQADPLVAAAPALLIAIPLLLIGIIVWLGVVRQHPSSSTRARWAVTIISVVVIGGALTFAFVVVPIQTRGGLLDTWWWVAVPDLAVSTALMLVLSAAAIVMLVAHRRSSGSDDP